MPNELGSIWTYFLSSTALTSENHTHLPECHESDTAAQVKTHICSFLIQLHFTSEDVGGKYEKNNSQITFSYKEALLQ